MGKISWVTYARPFAKRRAIYRTMAANRHDCGHWEAAYRSNENAEAIEWMWDEFKAAMEKEIRHD